MAGAAAAVPEWPGTVPGYYSGSSSGDVVDVAALWQQVKSPVVVPLLRLSVSLCLAMSVMLFAEKVYMAVVLLVSRLPLLGRRPEQRYRWEPIVRDGDLEAGGGGGGDAAACYPMVLVQIPMYNEREVSESERERRRLSAVPWAGRPAGLL